MSNQRYQSDSRSSTFNLHSLFTRFVDEYGAEGSKNLLDNPELNNKFIVSGLDSWPDWDYSDFADFTKPDERFFISKNVVDGIESLWQDITEKVSPGQTYTLIFKGVVEQDSILEIVGGPYDIINPDDLTQVGSSSVTIAGSSDELYLVLRFQTATTMSVNPIRVRLRPQTLNTYVRFDKVILKNGWLEVSDLFTPSFLERSVRYNETAEIWEITSDNGVSWEQFGTSVSGDVYAAIADMVVTNVENGISVYYTSGDQKLNFDVADFTLTFIGDVSGAGTITNLGNTSITLNVTDDGHNHTTATITDFAAGVNAGIDGRINDGGFSASDLWSADKITSEIATKEDAFSKNSAFNKNFGTNAGDVSEGDHTHQAGEITDTNTAYNKDFGTTSGTVAEGDHTHGTFSEVSVLSGIIAHGGTIPLPPGYTEGQCKWMVSPSSYNDNTGGSGGGTLTCSANGTRIVTMSFTYYGGSELGWLTTTGNANYMIIGVK